MRMAIQCSNASLCYVCPASTYQSDVTFSEPAGEEAEIGKVVHEAIAKAFRKEDYNLTEVCSVKELNEAECLRLITSALEYMEQVVQETKYDTIQVEQFVETPECALYGFFDAILINSRERTGVLIDWKTGLHPVDRHQILAYAYLASLKYDLKSVQCHIVYLRKAYADVFTYNNEQLENWYKEWTRRVYNNDGTVKNIYNPGQHCNYCHRLISCPGVTGLLQSFSEVTSVDKEDLVSLYHKASLMEKSAYRVKELIKSIVSSQGGKYKSATGELSVSNRTYKDVHLGTAHQFIGEYVDLSTIAEKLTISQSKLEDILRSVGMDRKTVNSLMETLEQNGAIDQRTTTYINVTTQEQEVKP